MALVEKAVERGVAKNPDGMLADRTPYAALLTESTNVAHSHLSMEPSMSRCKRRSMAKSDRA